jgi:hypothetical protein
VISEANKKRRACGGDPEGEKRKDADPVDEAFKEDAGANGERTGGTNGHGNKSCH